MTTPQGGQLDINSTQINATHNEMADIVKILASRAGNHVGQIARLLAEKAMLEEENARLRADNERLAKVAPEKAKA